MRSCGFISRRGCKRKWHAVVKWLSCSLSDQRFRPKNALELGIGVAGAPNKPLLYGASPLLVFCSGLTALFLTLLTVDSHTVSFSALLVVDKTKARFKSGATSPSDGGIIQR